jgi:acetyltransferase-like isoleucine patch superfamily enzyme
MTPLSTLLSIFPGLVLLLSAASLIWLCGSPSLLSAIALLVSLYGLPLLVYRLHQWRYPVTEGISYLQGKTYSPWWGSHQIQVIYIALPILETVLRLIPGAFSFWLRLWGANIGQGVYWTPHLEIADRGLLDVGDRAVIGHGVGIYAHAIKPKRDDLMLYVKRVKIGHRAFVSGGCRLGPGTVIADAAFVPVATDFYPNAHTTYPASSQESPSCAG